MKLVKHALIVEDLAETRDWLQQALALAFDDPDVTAVDSLAAARDALAVQRFDLALVDLGLPDGNGSELIAEIVRDTPKTIPVVTTIFDDDASLWASLRAGAQGYLLKQQPRAELVQLLQGILQGQPPLSPSVARRILANFHRPQVPDDLSCRERQVLTLIARGFRISDVARDLGLSPHTVHGYVKSIYQKLGVSTRAEAALAASRHGLLDPG